MEDAGCESLENSLYLDATGQTSLIEPANYGQKKRKKFQKQIGRIENTEYDLEENCLTCAQGRKLAFRRECTEVKDGEIVSTVWYRCEDCRGCPYLTLESIPGFAVPFSTQQNLFFHIFWLSCPFSDEENRPRRARGTV